MTGNPPSLVLALAARLRMTPIAWKEYPDRVVICFAEGPKLTFDRSGEKSTTTPTAAYKPKRGTTRKPSSRGTSRKENRP